jgi:Na+-transporting methylmalonyl-CoA/oxaloacetate decarboxylase beta subunit
MYISGCITIILGLIYILFNYMINKSERATSIGNIGDVDGPTAVFVTTHTGWLSLEILFVFFVVLTIIFYLLKNLLTR